MEASTKLIAYKLFKLDHKLKKQGVIRKDRLSMVEDYRKELEAKSLRELSRKKWEETFDRSPVQKSYDFEFNTQQYVDVLTIHELPTDPLERLKLTSMEKLAKRVAMKEINELLTEC
jgi:hypothetical protein